MSIWDPTTKFNSHQYFQLHSNWYVSKADRHNIISQCTIEWTVLLHLVSYITLSGHIVICSLFYMLVWIIIIPWGWWTGCVTYWSSISFLSWPFLKRRSWTNSSLSVAVYSLEENPTAAECINLNMPQKSDKKLSCRIYFFWRIG